MNAYIQPFLWALLSVLCMVCGTSKMPTKPFVPPSHIFIISYVFKAKDGTIGTGRTSWAVDYPTHDLKMIETLEKWTREKWELESVIITNVIEP